MNKEGGESRRQGGLTGLLQILSFICDAEVMAPCAVGISSTRLPQRQPQPGIPQKEGPESYWEVMGPQNASHTRLSPQMATKFWNKSQGDLPASSREGKSQSLLEWVPLQHHLAWLFRYMTMFCLNSCHTGGWWRLFTSWTYPLWAGFQRFDLQVTFLSCYADQQQTGERAAIQQHS